MKRLFIGALAAVLGATPVLATSWEDTTDLARIVESTGTTIVSSDDCARGVQGSYKYSDQRSIDVLTICKNNIDHTDPDAVWEVMAHESIHVAQACLGDNLYKDEYIPRIFRTLRTDAPHYARLLNNYPDDHRLREAEAFYAELLAPNTVKEMVAKACGVKQH